MEPGIPEIGDYVSGKRVESTALIHNSSLLSAPNVVVPDDKVSPYDLPADASAISMIPAMQRSPYSAGTVQSLIDMEMS